MTVTIGERFPPMVLWHLEGKPFKITSLLRMAKHDSTPYPQPQPLKIRESNIATSGASDVKSSSLEGNWSKDANRHFERGIHKKPAFKVVICFSMVQWSKTIA